MPALTERKNRSLTATALLCLPLLYLLSCMPITGSVVEAPPAAASLSAWDAWCGDAHGRRYAPVDQITPDNVSRLVERKSVGTKFGCGNLQAVYGYDRCIDRTLLFVPPEKQDWLKDVQASLRKRLYLTKAQAQGVENWFKHIPGHQPLSPKGFQWAWPKTRSALVTDS